MSLAEQIYKEARRLPEPLNREVLDFIGYLEHKYGLDCNDADALIGAQEPVMERLWANTDDDIWNDW